MVQVRPEDVARTDVTGELVQGIYLVGEFLSVAAGKEWTGRDGETRKPYRVRLLVRDQTQSIEYPDERSAREAIAGAVRGDVLSLRVFTRANADRVYYSGPRARDED